MVVTSGIKVMGAARGAVHCVSGLLQQVETISQSAIRQVGYVDTAA